jgi:hypothetical protein
MASPTNHNLLTGYFYRPIKFSLLVAIYSFTHGNPFYFHLLQIILFATCAYLLFIFFRNFFSKKISLLLSLIFLIHPVNNELGAYIAAYCDTLCLLFSLSALILIGRVGDFSLKRSVFVGFFILLALLSKESGVIFALMCLIYSAYQKAVRYYLIPIFSALLIYLICRMSASTHVMFTYLPSPVPILTPLSHFFLAVQLIFVFIREILMPTGNDSISLISSTASNILHIFILLFIVGVLSGFLLWLVKYKRQPVRKMVFFVIWACLGMILFLQLMPLEVIFAERYLYITEIGLLGILGIVITSIKVSRSKWIYLCWILFVMYLLLLAGKTFYHNILWIDWRTYMKL